MKKAFGDYQRVSANGKGSLWVGPDHLLVIESMGFLLPFSEKYRRIDFSNIQDLSWTTTRRRARFSVLFGIFLAIVIWGLIANRDSLPALVIWGALTLITATILLVNVARCPTVDFRVRTAVQLLRLRSVTRQRKAEALIHSISPHCLAHQAPLPGSSTPEAVPPTTALASAPSIAGIKPTWPGSKLVLWALLIQALSGLLTVTDVFVPSSAFTLGEFAVGLTAMVLIVAALTRSLRFQLPDALKTALVGSTILYGIGFVLGIVIFISALVMTVQNGPEAFETMRRDPNHAVFQFLAESSFEELGWIAWSLLIYGAFTAIIAAVGIPSALSRSAPEATTPPPVPGSLETAAVSPPDIPKSPEPPRAP